MIKICFAFLITLTSFNVNAQLTDTKWKGTLDVQGGMQVEFVYGKDTLDVINTQDSSSLETMKYTVKDSVVTIQKISGSSQCDPSTPGKYKLIIKGDIMTMSLVADDCYDRSTMVSSLVLKKI